MKRAAFAIVALVAAGFGGWVAHAETAPCLRQVAVERRLTIGGAGEPWPVDARALYVRCEDFAYYMDHPELLVWPG